MALSDFHSVREASAFAERLRQRIVSLRKQRNLSQRDIAQVLGITDQTVSNWEQGRSEPRLTIRQVVLLCRILDCSLTDLDGGDETIDPTIQVFGYHGTSREKANTILSEGFRVSDNDYDWLGEGVYFFQDAPYRAMQWATQQHPQNPAVIRSLIQLDNCIDLLDIKWFPPLKIVYNSFREGYQRFERPLPKQNPTLSKAHRLDCAFFNYATELLRSQGQEMEAIRAVFVEGENMFPSSAIFDLAHIQIAVKNKALIKNCQLI